MEVRRARALEPNKIQNNFDAIKIFTILFTFDIIFHCFVDKWGVF